MRMVAGEPHRRTEPRGREVRRFALKRTRRHLYLVIDGNRVAILAVWGSVRGVLPRLRARAARLLR
jgi:hypothetical protein